MNYLVTYEKKNKETITVKTYSYEVAKRVCEYAQQSNFYPCSITTLNDKARREMLISDLTEMIIKEEIEKLIRGL